MTSTDVSLGPSEAPTVLGTFGGDRLASWRRAFECDLPGTREEFERTMALAQRQGWPEVGRSALYGVLRHAAESSPADALALSKDLLEAAQRDGDLDMAALALSWRAWLGTVHGVESQAVVDEDLARAVVLLERPDGDPVVKATAHFRVAFSMWHRRLWELTDAQLESAERMVDEVDPLRRDPLLHRAALALDRVLLDLDWALTLRQVGDDTGLSTLREAQRCHVAKAAPMDMPGAWRDHISIAAMIMDVLCGDDRSHDVTRWLASIIEGTDQAEWVPSLHLALALCTSTAPEQAATAVEQSINAAGAAGDSSSPALFLALYQAAVLEARLSGKTTAGLRSTEALCKERELTRQAVSAGQLAAIGGQRLRGERDLLSRQARSDPLTGLANRRGLQSHLAALSASGTTQVALVLMDIDQFKAVNDHYGHLAGDKVLQKVSEVMSANVRSDDFLARLGGDEFLLLLPHLDHVAASRRAQAVASAVAGLLWSDISDDLEICLSYGLAVGDPSSMLELTHEADVALYRSKLAGRMAS